MSSSSGRSFARAVAVSLIAAVLLIQPIVLATERHGARDWVGTWTASPQVASSPLQINGQTLRQIVHTSIGGDSVRIRLSNVYGTADLVVGAARVALSAGGAAIVDGTDRMLRFNGSPAITIPPGTLAVSDPVRLRVPALGDLAVSIYLPGNILATTRHDIGLQTNYVSSPGDFTGATDVTGTTTQSFYFLTAVEVRAPERAGAIVTLGDSVTDGFASTPDMNQRWPNLLAERLQGFGRTSDMAVLNAGISGNRLLRDIVGPGSLSRLDRDVLVQSGATHLIVAQGNTDILIPDLIGIPAQNVSAAQIIQGHVQVIDSRTCDGPPRLRRYVGSRGRLSISGLLDAGDGGESARQSTSGSARAARTTPSSTSTKSSAIPRMQPVCYPTTTAAIMCIRTIVAIARWRTRST